jgi:hypothetical protein
MIELCTSMILITCSVFFLLLTGRTVGGVTPRASLGYTRECTLGSTPLGGNPFWGVGSIVVIVGGSLTPTGPI